MTFATNSGVLGANVVTGGTFTVALPGGRQGGDFQGGINHYLTINQRLYAAPNDFTVVFAQAIATITWKGLNTLLGGSPFRVQFDIPGSNAEVVGMPRTSGMEVRRFDLGTPTGALPAALRAAAAVAAAGPLALIAAATILDQPRNVTITTTGNDAARTVTIKGFDEYGAAMTETMPGPNIATGQGKKAFKKVTSVEYDGAAAANVSVGFGNVLGLPAYLPAASNILQELQDNVTAAAGTKTPGLSTAVAATLNGADVRGTYVPAVPPDGLKAFALLVLLSDPGSKGVPQI